MSQLFKGMYGTEFNHRVNLFGLSCGQMCGGGTKMTHNSGWYNKKGEKLGWGDLSAENFNKISEEIEPNELFITLGEQASFWNFNSTRAVKGIIGEQQLTEDAPGIEYVAQHAQFIISRHQLWHVSDYAQSGVEDHHGLIFTVIRSGQVPDLISASPL